MLFPAFQINKIKCLLMNCKNELELSSTTWRLPHLWKGDRLIIAKLSCVPAARGANVPHGMQRSAICRGCSHDILVSMQ